LSVDFLDPFVLDHSYSPHATGSTPRFFAWVGWIVGIKCRRLRQHEIIGHNKRHSRFT
jgi:hypothetical protein